MSVKMSKGYNVKFKEKFKRVRTVIGKISGVY